VREGIVLIFSLPIGLNRISWKLVVLSVFDQNSKALPIGLNRISWKPGDIAMAALVLAFPTYWVK